MKDSTNSGEVRVTQDLVSRLSARESILLVDDDDPFRRVLARALRTRGYEVRIAGDYDRAIESILLDPPRVAVVDLRMPGRSGFELIEAIRKLCPESVVIVLSGVRGTEAVAEAIRRGAANYLTKPVDVDDLVMALVAATSSGGQFPT